MALPFDPGGDFLDVVDGFQPVTLVRPGSSATTAVEHALRRAIRTREAQASQGQYTSGDVIWQIPAAEAPEAPRLGDAIVDASGRRWTILNVRAATRDSRWRCITRDLAIAHRLDEAIRIERATYAKGPSGAEEPTWRLWKSGVRARIQPVGAEVQRRHERTAAVTAYRIFVAEDPELDPHCRVRGPDGTVYRVIGFHKAERIDALAQIDAERVE
jgi:hypothetical protein